MSYPLVTIIIPVYNGENYLAQAIDSALAQTYSNIEILVVNDGSKDQGATEKVALSYGDKIRYVRKENGGVSTALNLGIEKMSGEYFSWLSHDDLYYPDKINRQIQALRDHGDMTAIVHSDYDILEESTKSITQVRQSYTYPMNYLTNSVLPVLHGLVHGCSLLIHKSHFKRVGVFNETLITTQDYELWFRMMRNQQLIYVPEPLIIGRVHELQRGRILTSHRYERNELHIGFMNDLTNEEMESMYGSPYNFYHRMSCFFKGIGMDESYRHAIQKMHEADIPRNLSEQLSGLQRYIKALSGGIADKIVIFGAGEYGMRLNQELRSKLISVDSFSDNNQAKWGSKFEDVECISPQQLEAEKERTLVIVAAYAPTEILNQLKLQGFPYVTTKQEIDNVLFEVPPLKWISALDAIENHIETSVELQQMRTRYNKAIFEICKYYEELMD